MDLPEQKDNHKPERLEMIRQLRSVATKLRLKYLSDVLASSSYIVLNPEKSLKTHLRILQTLLSTLATPDAILCLADCEVPCHSFLLAVRCPFFGAMLDSAGLGGGWLASRRREALVEGNSEIRIQLKHLSYSIMSLVLEHIYCDAGAEVFDHVRKETVDEFLEFVIEVMAVANELLLNPLKDICQYVLSRFGRFLAGDADNSDAQKRCDNN
jgi:hypothetical protein